MFYHAYKLETGQPMQYSMPTNQHREPDRSTAGFTLLEALVATALAGFLAMGIVSMMTFA